MVGLDSAGKVSSIGGDVRRGLRDAGCETYELRWSVWNFVHDSGRLEVVSMVFANARRKNVDTD